MSTEKVITAYMCKVQWDFELGQASGRYGIYGSVEDCKKYSPCIDQCGIVEVEVRFKRDMDRAVEECGA